MSKGIPCIWMRGGTSKGAYFLARDLPDAGAERDGILLSVMGSPDPRQIDGIGGADPLTSIDGVEATCIDNGMPVVVMRASDLGITGYESREDLDADAASTASTPSGGARP